jgi:hypothetical protein
LKLKSDIIFSSGNFGFISKPALIFLSAIIILFSDGCKKGEEDPLISLRTRTARLKNTWKLISATRSETESYVLPEMTIVTNSEYDGEKEIILTNSGQTITDTLFYNVQYEFQRDYRYQKKYVGKNPDNPADNVILYEEGRWEFLTRSKTENVRNKEQLLLMPEKITAATEENELNYETVTWTLVRLSHNEIKAVIEENYSNSLSGYQHSIMQTMEFTTGSIE